MILRVITIAPLALVSFTTFVCSATLGEQPSEPAAKQAERVTPLSRPSAIRSIPREAGPVLEQVERPSQELKQIIEPGYEGFPAASPDLQMLQPEIDYAGKPAGPEIDLTSDTDEKTLTARCRFAVTGMGRVEGASINVSLHTVGSKTPIAWSQTGINDILIPTGQPPNAGLIIPAELEVTLNNQNIPLGQEIHPLAITCQNAWFHPVNSTLHGGQERTDPVLLVRRPYLAKQ